MKNSMKKIAVAMAILGITSIAQAESKDYTITFTGTIAQGCMVLNTISTTVDGNVGGVGKSGAIPISVECNGSVSYNLMPVNDVVTVTGGPEEIRLTAWKDSGFTQQLTSAANISSSSPSATHQIYLRANGPVGNADEGSGNILAKGQTFSTTFPIKLVY